MINKYKILFIKILKDFMKNLYQIKNKQKNKT